MHMLIDMTIAMSMSMSMTAAVPTLPGGFFAINICAISVVEDALGS